MFSSNLSHQYVYSFAWLASLDFALKFKIKPGAAICKHWAWFDRLNFKKKIMARYFYILNLSDLIYFPVLWKIWHGSFGARQRILVSKMFWLCYRFSRYKNDLSEGHWVSKGDKNPLFLPLFFYNKTFVPVEMRNRWRLI